MSDTLRALADDSLAAVLTFGGPAGLVDAIADGDPDAQEIAESIEQRALALGASVADVVAALRVAGARRGMLPTVH